MSGHDKVELVFFCTLAAYAGTGLLAMPFIGPRKSITVAGWAITLAGIVAQSVYRWFLGETIFNTNKVRLYGWFMSIWLGIGLVVFAASIQPPESGVTAKPPPPVKPLEASEIGGWRVPIDALPRQFDYAQVADVDVAVGGIWCLSHEPGPYLAVQRRSGGNIQVYNMSARTWSGAEFSLGSGFGYAKVRDAIFALSADGRFFAAANKHRLCAWSTITGEKVHESRLPYGDPRALQISDSKLTLVFFTQGSSSYTIRRADLSDGQSAETFNVSPLPKHQAVEAFGLSPNARYLVAYDPRGAIVLMDLQAKSSLGKAAFSRMSPIPRTRSEQTAARGLLFSRDGASIAGVFRESIDLTRITIWNASDGRIIQEYLYKDLDVFGTPTWLMNENGVKLASRFIALLDTGKVLKLDKNVRGLVIDQSRAFTRDQFLVLDRQSPTERPIQLRFRMVDLSMRVDEVLQPWEPSSESAPKTE